jgi:hypothetical protein
MRDPSPGAPFQGPSPTGRGDAVGASSRGQSELTGGDGVVLVDGKSGGRLAGAVGRLGWGRGEVGGTGDGFERRVGSTGFEQVTREWVDGMSRQLDQLVLKVNGVFLVLIGAVVAEIYWVVVKH